MTKELPFVIYCIEEYKNSKNMSGKDVLELFDRYSVCDYIREFYDVLHTTGPRYFIDDIDAYIESRRNEQSN